MFTTFRTYHFGYHFDITYWFDAQLCLQQASPSPGCTSRLEDASFKMHHLSETQEPEPATKKAHISRHDPLTHSFIYYVTHKIGTSRVIVIPINISFP